MKRLASFSALALTVMASSGCAWLWGKEGYFRDRGSDYLAAREVAPMQVPQDVQVRPLDSLLPIPARVPLPVATGKEGFEVPRPLALGEVSPPSSVTLQKGVDQRWLVAQRPPAEVWPLAREFFERVGLPVASDRPERGELVSSWAPLSGALARHLDNPKNEVSVRLRVEPGVQRNTSEISLLTNVRPAGSGANPAWPRSPVVPTLDALLLEQLLGHLEKGAAGRGSSVSLLANRSFDAPSKASVSADKAGNPLLILVSDADRSWSALGRALQEEKITVDDMDRTQGVYFINLSGEKPNEKPGFFSRLWSKSDNAERYQVRLKAVSGVMHVTVEKEQQPAPADVARKLLTQLRDRLN